MKKVMALCFAVLIAVLAAVPVFAAKDKNPSPTKPKEYTIIVHNNNGGTGTYTTELDEDGRHATLVAHPKNGYRFKGWKINGKYVLEVGKLTDKEITILLQGDVEATPIFEKIGSKSSSSSSPTSSSTSSGSTISINSSTTSPQTSDNNGIFFIIAFAAVFAVIACAVGVKLAVSKK